VRKQILLTGATGYLGGHLIKALLANEWHVIALKRKHSAWMGSSYISENIHFVDVEEGKIDELFSEFGKINTIIHTATCYGRGNESASEIFSVNIDLPLRLLEAGIKYGVERFINTDTALDQSFNKYTLSKSQFLQWGKFLSNDKKIRFINLRLEHFYGPGDKVSSFPVFIVNSCIKNIPELNLSKGEQQRDFIYIDDVVSAYIAVIEGLFKDDKYFFEIDVGSGTSVSIRTFVEMVKEITKSSVKLNFGAIPYRVGEPMFSRANISELNALGWSCCYELADGLNKMISIEGSRI